VPDPLPCSERLLAAITAALAGITVAGRTVTVERDRTLPVDESEMPRLIVFQDQTAVDQALIGGTDVWTLTAAIAGYVAFPAPSGTDRAGARQAAEASARQAAATLQAMVHQRLCGGAPAGDLTLAQDIRPAGSPPPDRLMIWQADPGRAFTALFDVEFETPNGNPFAFLS